MVKQKRKAKELHIDYYATGVWLSDSGVTTHLYLHKLKNGLEIAMGDRVSIEETIKLLEEGKTIRTMRWSYIRAEWVAGVLLKIILLSNGEKSVKSGSGNVVTDNLEHLILMHQML